MSLEGTGKLKLPNSLTLAGHHASPPIEGPSPNNAVDTVLLWLLLKEVRASLRKRVNSQSSLVRAGFIHKLHFKANTYFLDLFIFRAAILTTEP